MFLEVKRLSSEKIVGDEHGVCQVQSTGEVRQVYTSAVQCANFPYRIREERAAIVPELPMRVVGERSDVHAEVAEAFVNIKGAVSTSQSRR